MRVAVKAHPYQKEEWLLRQTSEDVSVIWADNDVPEADVYFDMTFEGFGLAFPGVTDKTVFINAVIETLTALPANASRFNGWSSFFKKESLEVVCRDDNAKKVLNEVGWKYQQAPDVPGMIAPRTVSMIVNEAYFALGDEVSTKDEIDIAMKLGTNYPYGPFEWSRLIGLPNIYRLLKKLSEYDNRYQPAPSLEQELKSIA